MARGKGLSGNGVQEFTCLYTDTKKIWVIHYSIYEVEHEQERRILEEYMEIKDLTSDIFNQHPHEISGGQAQRVALLRSIMLKPRILIANEATSMLDVSVQA